MTTVLYTYAHVCIRHHKFDIVYNNCVFVYILSVCVLSKLKIVSINFHYKHVVKMKLCVCQLNCQTMSQMARYMVLNVSFHAWPPMPLNLHSSNCAGFFYSLCVFTLTCAHVCLFMLCKFCIPACVHDNFLFKRISEIISAANKAIHYIRVLPYFKSIDSSSATIVYIVKTA